MTTDLGHSPLAKNSPYVETYTPTLLFPIPRRETRQKLDFGCSLPFCGGDLWNAYELSWLNAKGKPVIAIAEIYFPCNSENIIESKSLKLYLNSFTQSHFPGSDSVENQIRADLSLAAGASVPVFLSSPSTGRLPVIRHFEGRCLDELDVAIDNYCIDQSTLQVARHEVAETVVSHLLKSNCPVTSQPDWASVLIRYRGKQIIHEGLLRYIISFRHHQDFHEHCVEQIYSDLTKCCRPSHLTVYARFTRRGGIDINPFRSNFETLYANWRLPRQ